MSQQYPNSPIREVVCEFRYQEDGHWDGAAPGLVYAALRADFPRRLTEDQPAISVAGSVEPPNVLPPQLQQLGLGLRVVTHGPLKFWRDGDDSGYFAVAPYRLSLHHFQPYPSWEGLREIVNKGTNAYREVLKPSRVERIGLRYINEIKLGSPRVELEDYFDFHPLVGSNLPQDFSRFHCFVQLAFEDNRDSLILQIGSKPDPIGEEAVIVLDLDYFLADPSKLKIEESTDWIEKAHANLESVFEGCLKDRVRELFH